MRVVVRLLIFSAVNNAWVNHVLFTLDELQHIGRRLRHVYLTQ